VRGIKEYAGEHYSCIHSVKVGEVFLVDNHIDNWYFGTSTTTQRDEQYEYGRLPADHCEDVDPPRPPVQKLQQKAPAEPKYSTFKCREPWKATGDNMGYPRAFHAVLSKWEPRGKKASGGGGGGNKGPGVINRTLTPEQIAERDRKSAEASATAEAEQEFWRQKNETERLQRQQEEEERKRAEEEEWLQRKAAMDKRDEEIREKLKQEAEQKRKTEEEYKERDRVRQEEQAARQAKQAAAADPQTAARAMYHTFDKMIQGKPAMVVTLMEGKRRDALIAKGYPDPLTNPGYYVDGAEQVTTQLAATSISPAAAPAAAAGGKADAVAKQIYMTFETVIQSNPAMAPMMEAKRKAALMAKGYPDPQVSPEFYQ